MATAGTQWLARYRRRVGFARRLEIAARGFGGDQRSRQELDQPDRAARSDCRRRGICGLRGLVAYPQDCLADHISCSATRPIALKDRKTVSALVFTIAMGRCWSAVAAGVSYLLSFRSERVPPTRKPPEAPSPIADQVPCRTSPTSKLWPSSSGQRCSWPEPPLRRRNRINRGLRMRGDLAGLQKAGCGNSERGCRVHQAMGPEYANDERGMGRELSQNASLFPGEALATDPRSRPTMPLTFADALSAAQTEPREHRPTLCRPSTAGGSQCRR